MKKLHLHAIIAAASCITAISCATSTGKSNDTISLEGKWHLTTYSDPSAGFQQTRTEEGSDYTLEFMADGTFYITTDCNTVSGSYITDGDKLRFENTFVTEMACENETVERCVKESLPLMDRYAIDSDSTLTFTSEKGAVLLEFQPKSR